MRVPLFPLSHQLLAQHLHVRNKTFGFINYHVHYKPRDIPDVLRRLNVSVFTDYPSKNICFSVFLSLLVILNLTPRSCFMKTQHYKRPSRNSLQPSLGVQSVTAAPPITIFSNFFNLCTSLTPTPK